MAKKQTNQHKTRIPLQTVQKNIEEQGFIAKNKEIFLLAVVLLITIVIYFPALNHSFTNWDDNDYITGNQYIKSLSPENLQYIFTEPIALNYHPLTMLSLALNYRLSGEEPASYFFVNILFHLFNTLLTFYFAFLLLGRNKLSALFVAAIFAVHPMHVESVAWISERKDVLYTFFFLSGLISWIFFMDKRRWPWYLLSFVLFVLSGLSKPSSVVFPLILLLLDYFYKRKFNLLSIVEKLPFFAISIFIGLATLHAQIGISVVDIKQFNLIQQFLFASYGFFIYIAMLIFPVGLSALHPVPAFNTSLDLPWIYSVTPVINLVIVGFILYSLKNSRMLFFGLIFYFLNIFLTLQVIQVGSAVMAERYTYLSYIGLLTGLSWLMTQTAIKRKIAMKWIYLVMVVFFGLMAILSFQRVSVWKNSGSLWTDVISKYPKSHTAYNNRGYFYVQEKKYDKALPDFTKAIDLMPNFADALNNRGGVYRLLDQNRLAVVDYTNALLIQPDYVNALAGRGNAYAGLGLLDSALIDLNKAFKINPALANALGDRGSVYFRLGQFENAIEDCSRKIAIDPENITSYLNRGVAYSSLQKWDLALKDYTVVLNATPENLNVYEWRGVAFRCLGSYQPAIDDFSRGIKMSPAKSSLYVNRAVAYKKAGMLQEAINDVKMARKLGANVTEQSVFSILN
jgi:tetratricopeptide (TPR) repeat protein